MGVIRFFERSDGDARRFDEAMKRAKAGLMEACEIWEDMKDQFSERDWNDHADYRMRGGYRSRDDYGDYDERRDRMGRYAR